MRWGLYRGDDILEPGLLVYLRAFESALGREARSRLYTRLAGLPPIPDETTPFRGTYDALKAYLILTDEPTRSSVEFLPDAILANWEAGANLQGERAELLRAQLDFFADVIREGNPVAGESDAAVIASSRTFLRAMSQDDQFYLNVLGQAATRGQEIRLATAVPNSATLLRNDVVVEPHFTLSAYDWVREVDAQEMLQSEDWVLGPQSVPVEDVAALGDSVKARYRAEYGARWLEFLEATSVVPFNGVADASRKLDGLAAPDSPLLGVLALVAYHTRPLNDEFQPLLSVYPPPPPGEDGSPAEEDTRLIRDSNQGYVDALRGLEGALDAVAQSPRGGEQGAVQAALGAVRDGEGAVDAIRDQFELQPDMARTAGEAVRDLLQAPLRRSEALLGRFGSDQVNGAGASFCGQFNGFLSGYPFQRGAAANADMASVISALEPGGSLLASFVQDQLVDAGLVVRQGPRYAVRSGADPAPTDEFMRFLNDAVAASESLFDNQGNPEVQFTLLPETTTQLTSITIRIDGITQRTTPTNRREVPFRWNGSTAREVEISAEIAGEVVPLLQPTPGPWALFRLFESADWADRGGDRYGLTWQTSAGQVLRAQLSLTESPPIFRPGVLDGIRCVSRVVR
jgi:type VI protein secretion system component VasK